MSKSTFYINLNRYELHCFKVKETGTYLLFDTVEVKINDPVNAISQMQFKPELVKLLTDIKPKLVSFEPGSGLTVNLAPLIEMNIFPKTITCFINDRKLTCLTDSVFVEERFKMHDSQFTLRIVMEGYPTLCYLASGKTTRFLISDHQLEQYILQYCTHYLIFGQKAAPEKLNAIAMKVFGRKINNDISQNLSVSLGYFKSDPISYTSLVIIVFFIALFLLIRFILIGKRSGTPSTRLLKENSRLSAELLKTKGQLVHTEKKLQAYQQDSQESSKQSSRLRDDIFDQFKILKDELQKGIASPANIQVNTGSDLQQDLLREMLNKIEENKTTLLEKVDGIDTRMSIIQELYYKIQNKLDVLK